MELTLLAGWRRAIRLGIWARRAGGFGDAEDTALGTGLAGTSCTGEDAGSKPAWASSSPGSPARRGFPSAPALPQVEKSAGKPASPYLPGAQSGPAPCRNPSRAPQCSPHQVPTVHRGHQAP